MSDDETSRSPAHNHHQGLVLVTRLALKSSRAVLEAPVDDATCQRMLLTATHGILALWRALSVSLAIGLVSVIRKQYLWALTSTNRAYFDGE